jgi:putative membrane protein
MLLPALVLLPALAAMPAAAQSKSHKESLSDPMLYLAPGEARLYASNLAYGIDTLGGGGSPIETLSDSKILFVTHIANASAVAQAKLARERAHDVRVRRIASAIQLQHERADRHEEDLIRRRSLDMTSTPTGIELQQAEQQVLGELQQKFGADFDRAFLEAQIESHRRVLELIDQKLLPGASDSDIQSYVRDLRPTVEGHLARLQALQLKVKE